MKYVPSLDKKFQPLIHVLHDYKQNVLKATKKELLTICLERNDGYNYIYRFDIFADNTGHDDETYHIVERIIKTLLWLVGGYKIYLSGSHEVYKRLANDYSKTGCREFDVTFMERVYEKKFEILLIEEKDIPTFKPQSIQINDDLSGNRIGFDAGGSDRKVSAVVDGTTIFSEETVWNPKITPNPNYHYQGILESMKKAASYLNGKVDAIGVSSAGIYVNNQVKVASLFLKVNEEDFEKTVKNMYINIAKEFGDVPLVVANDGDVAALAGASSLKSDSVLGIAMGTSEAVGYVDEHGNLKGWLNELAFVPVDFHSNAMQDEWSGDIGCGVKYFSQDSVIKLAGYANIKLEEDSTPAQKLKVIQKLNEANDPIANEIFENIGIYLGYTIAYYAEFYKLKHVQLLGRVVSGKGGNTILEVATKVLHEEFPELANIQLSLPDEMARRVGQSEAAARLPNLR